MATSIPTTARVIVFQNYETPSGLDLSVNSPSSTFAVKELPIPSPIPDDSLLIQTLFLGNLGFETTEDSIRELLDSHRTKDAPSADEKWIRKIRLGTFEDSGKCKGCVLTSANYYVSTTCPQTPCARLLQGVSL